MSLRDIDSMHDGLPKFTTEEKEKIRAMRFPGDPPPGYNTCYYPQRPKENPQAWFAEHAAKLRSLERAEGY